MAKSVKSDGAKSKKAVAQPKKVKAKASPEPKRRVSSKKPDPETLTVVSEAVSDKSKGSTKASLQSKVLNLMKYRATEGKDPEKKSSAQKFLDLYGGKSSKDKEEMLLEYEKNGGRNSNMNWLMAIESKSSDHHGYDMQRKSGMFTRSRGVVFFARSRGAVFFAIIIYTRELTCTSFCLVCRNQILKMNDINPDGMEFDEKARLVQLLIEESRKEFHYEFTWERHDSERELDKFLYYMDLGVTSYDGTKNSQEVSIYQHDIQKNKALKWDQTAVKFECDEFKNLSKALDSLKKEKTKLKSNQDKLEGLEVQLRLKSQSDPALTPKHDTLKNGLETVKNVMDALLVKIIEAQSYRGDEDPAKLHEVAQGLEKTLQTVTDAKDASSKVYDLHKGFA